MITGRPVLQPDGMEPVVCHGWTINDVPERNTTLHNNNPDADYVASTFDVVHDAGLSTAMYRSKDKFIIYEQTYNETAGAHNPHGRNKIDAYSFTRTMARRLLGDDERALPRRHGRPPF